MGTRTTKQDPGPVNCDRCGENIKLLDRIDLQWGCSYHSDCYLEDEKDWEWLRESNAIEGVFDDDSFQQALHAWHYLLNQGILNGGVVMKTHKILMLHQPLMPNEKGYWRRQQVWVGGREGINWRDIPQRMAAWFSAVESTIGTSHVSTVGLMRKYPSLMANGGEKQDVVENLIKEDHITYERIHPFVDGNGRTGRMFMNWQRKQCGLEPLLIKDSKKRGYYDWFREK